jgi:hypothetical protein
MRTVRTSLAPSMLTSPTRARLVMAERTMTWSFSMAILGRPAI